ncbi:MULTISPECIES: DoxX family protein [unclassified Tenacibaculum]|uniref:DoxX family protein n=1 Tax=unclassified Tenacibaculum TaxID=2635139 RepID=UPI001F3430F5|nr:MULTISPECIES: DoxX family protein [unclassified Tenacibaculum]MCF2874019.1 DoxX family protein [Tenacibaculum sp. Cn5-1]MCF2934600.1 DoxX family protein [Tenacibaculum sp. Cn5-34]MCG7510810.1 DoxX family protein [Tenacibaculum sp. Cn5-46]
MKRDKIIYYVATGLLSLLMLFSAGMYFFNNAEVSKMYEAFGYPTYIIYPYGIAKILGLVAIWFLRDTFLKEWAYAGFFFAFILAFFAHVMISDGQQMGAVMAMALLVISYIYNKKINA